MKISETEILIVPGYKNSGDDHWQSRWQSKLSTARRVHQNDWLKPEVEEWTTSLIEEVDTATKPLILIAHSLGSQVVVQAIQKMTADQQGKIAGAFLVAPPDVENPNIRPKHLMTFGPYPRDPLPFPSVVVASTDDPFCSVDVAGDMANCWGSLFIESGEHGHLDAASGHGPWPEGLMVFAEFMKRLG